MNRSFLEGGCKNGSVPLFHNTIHLDSCRCLGPLCGRIFSIKLVFRLRAVVSTVFCKIWAECIVTAELWLERYSDTTRPLFGAHYLGCFKPGFLFISGTLAFRLHGWQKNGFWEASRRGYCALIGPVSQNFGHPMNLVTP